MLSEEVCIAVAKPLTADCEQTKPNFFVKVPRSGAFTKKLVVGLFAICCKTVDAAAPVPHLLF